MERYIKNGKIRFRKQIVVRKDGMQIINPSEELVLADGWEIYTPVTPTPPTEEELLEREKRMKKDEINRYDSSEEINIFFVNEMPVWLDKATRAGLMLRFQAESAMGKTNTSLWYEEYKFDLTIEQALQMLYIIENYASICYDNTQHHLSMINTLETIEDVRAYDYKTGYPEKLKF